MSYIIKPRRGLKEDLPVLAEHEIAFTTDTKEIYVGSSLGNQRIGVGDIPTFKTINGQEIIGEGNISITADGGTVDLSGYQEKLVSGTNIKTVGGQPLLGSGNIPLPTVPTFKTVNGQEITGSGDIEITKDGATYLIPQETSGAEYAGKTICFIGDSITAGVGASEPSNKFTTILSNLLGATERNKGTNGTTMSTGGHRTSKIVSLTANDIRGSDVVLISIGINDWTSAVKDGYYGGVLTYDANATYYTLGTFGTDDTTTIYGAAKMWCDRVMELKAQSEFANIKFFFSTPIITSYNSSLTETKDFDQSKTNIHGMVLRDICDAIIETCAAYKIPVFDMNRYSGIYYNSEEDKTTNLYFGDGLHPNDAGHAKIAETLYWYLLQNPSYVGEEETVKYLLSQFSETTKLSYPNNFVAPIVTNYTFTINPTPSNATVTINGANTKFVTVAEGTNITWSVSADGYVTQSDTETVTGTTTKSVVLIGESGESYNVVLGGTATYDASDNVIGSTSTNTKNMITKAVQANALVNEPIYNGMEVEVELSSRDGYSYVPANHNMWSMIMLGLSKNNVLDDMTMNPYTNKEFPVGEANIYFVGPDSDLQIQYMRSSSALAKVPMGIYYTNGETVMSIKVIFRKNADGTMSVKAGDNDWFDYSSNATINALTQYQDGVSAETVYFFTSGVGATQVKVNYIGAIR